MGVFPRSEIYDHMDSAHVDISDDELPAGVDADGVPARDFVVQQAEALAQIEQQRADEIERQITDEIERQRAEEERQRARLDAIRRRRQQAEEEAARRQAHRRELERRGQQPDGGRWCVVM